MSLINLPLDQWLDNVALAALSSKETLLTTFDLARLVIERGIPGDFVECGVYGGAQCAVMARAIVNAGKWSDDRRVHLFDSFSGVPAGGPHDEGWTHPEGVSHCSLESVQAHMREWGIPDELLVYHPGPFSETMYKVAQSGHYGYKPIGYISILRIDCDLYESTRVCLEHLLPLVHPGGYVIMDDWPLPGVQKAVMESSLANLESGPAYFQVQPK